jgi:ABC-type Zn uptake system ZnuABC Zn-binding protein ZnuA
MVCRNIKSTLIDYEDNVSVKNDIENNYQKLKESISIIDVDIYNLSKNGNYKTLLVTNDTFNYLTKYGITVISIDPSNDSIDKSLSEAKRLIAKKDIKYIYSIKGEDMVESVNSFINDNKLNKIEIDPFVTISEEQRLNGSTYVSLMNNIIDEFKKELFK